MRLDSIYDPDYCPPRFECAEDALSPAKWDNVGMTVIAAIRLPDGFVVGADGRRLMFDGSVATNSAHKLFCLHNHNVTLAYGWCGHTVVWGGDNPKKEYFNFPVIARPILEIASWLAPDLSRFIRFTCTSLLSCLWDSHRVNGHWVEDCLSDNIARMLVAGYFKGDPFSLGVNVQRRGVSPVVFTDNFVIGSTLTVFSGPPTVEADDMQDRHPANADDARNIICEYVQRCDSDISCSGFGGRPHVAVVTPDSFRWIEAPEISD
jgi:hypothetical protein